MCWCESNHWLWRTPWLLITPVTPFKVHHRLVTSGPKAMPTPWKYYQYQSTLRRNSGEGAPVCWVRDRASPEGQSTATVKGFMRCASDIYDQSHTSPEKWCQLKRLDAKKKEPNIHMRPSCPGCLPTRGSFRISSSVTSSLLKRPPCTTKKRLRPSGDRIAPSLALGGFVGLTSVASGTDGNISRQLERLMAHRTYES